MEVESKSADIDKAARRGIGTRIAAGHNRFVGSARRSQADSNRAKRKQAARDPASLWRAHM
jgi:hypothetical protein